MNTWDNVIYKPDFYYSKRGAENLACYDSYSDKYYQYI